MQVRAHRLQEIEGANEGANLTAVEHVHPQHGVQTLGGVQVLGDPEQRVQVAKGALALLDVGLDHEPAGAGAGMALVALLQLGGDEFRARPLDHFGAEPGVQTIGQNRVADQAASLEDRGADRHVGAGQLDALVQGSRGVADFEPEIPQGVEHVFDHALGVRGLFVRANEQQIDIGKRGQRAAAVSAHRHQRQPLALGRVAGAEHVDSGEVPKGADHLVGDAAQQAGGFEAAGPILQPLLGDHPTAEQRPLEDVDRPSPLLWGVAHGVQCGRGKLRSKAKAVDDELDTGGTQTGRHLSI